MQSGRSRRRRRPIRRRQPAAATTTSAPAVTTCDTPRQLVIHNDHFRARYARFRWSWCTTSGRHVPQAVATYTKRSPRTTSGRHVYQALFIGDGRVRGKSGRGAGGGLGFARGPVTVREHVAQIPAAWGVDADGTTGPGAGAGQDAAVLPAVARLAEIPGVSTGRLTANRLRWLFLGQSAASQSQLRGSGLDRWSAMISLQKSTHSSQIYTRPSWGAMSISTCSPPFPQNEHVRSAFVVEPAATRPAYAALVSTMPPPGPGSVISLVMSSLPAADPKSRGGYRPAGVVGRAARQCVRGDTHLFR